MNDLIATKSTIELYIISDFTKFKSIDHYLHERVTQLRKEKKPLIYWIREVENAEKHFNCAGQLKAYIELLIKVLEAKIKITEVWTKTAVNRFNFDRKSFAFMNDYLTFRNYVADRYELIKEKIGE